MSATVVISSPPRGSVSFDSTAKAAQQVVITRSWGAQPATALIDFASEVPADPPPPGSLVQVSVEGHTFWGIATQPEHALSEGGFTMAHTCEDFRHFLQLDVVYGRFNQQDNQVVDGRLVRRFKHLLPVNVPAGLVTYTDTPYSAAQVLNFLLTSAWVESPWEIAWMNAAGVETWNVWHPVLQNFPVFDVDYSGGQRLGAALVEISERVGLTFGITGTPRFNSIRDGYRLCWVLRGDGGVLPQWAVTGGTSPFPPSSTNRRLGTQYAGNPTRLSVVGDQNLYQVLNVELEADWASGWEQFFPAGAFEEFVWYYLKDESGRSYRTHSHYYTDYGAAGVDRTAGYLAAAARANKITVAEFAAAVTAEGMNGTVYQDTRRYSGRSRMGLPAMLYVRALVYRAYRVKSGQSLTNVYGRTLSLREAKIVPGTVQDVIFKTTTGVMSAGSTYLVNGNGLVIAKGVRLLSEDMQLYRPEYFNLDDFTAENERWAELAFQVDESGEGYQFLVLDQPVAVTTDMFESVDGPGSVDFFFPKETPTITVATVKAALTFAAERFCYTAGAGERDGVESAPGLCGQFVCATPGATPVEVAFADGQTAQEKAAAIAASWLGRQVWFVSGGYTTQAVHNLRMHPMYNRLTVRYNPQSGFSEEVDFTAERPHQSDGWGNVVIEPPRNFDRRTLEWGQVAGLREQRMQAEKLRVQAEVLGAPKNAVLRAQMQQMQDMMTGFDSVWPVLLLDDSGTWTGNAGTPLFREATQNAPSRPGVALTSPVFVGATVNHQPARKPVAVTAQGHEGVLLVRVKGPAAVGDSVGYSASEDALVKDGSPAVGTLLDAVSEGDGKRVARVRVGVAGSGGSAVRLAKISSVANLASDYIEVLLATWSGSSASFESTAVKVAIPPGLRAADITACNTVNPVGYTHGRVPEYVVNDIIQVAQVPQGTGVTVSGDSLTWCDVTPGRALGVRLPLCLGGVPYYMKVHGGPITSS